MALSVGGITLLGRDSQSFKVGAVAEVHFPMDGDAVMLLNKMRGLEGTVTGWVSSWADASPFPDMYGSTVEVIVGDATFQALVVDVEVSATGELVNGTYQWDVAISVLGTSY